MSASGQIVNGNKLAKVGEEVARIRKRQSADLVQLQTETIYWKLVTLNATKQTLAATESCAYIEPDTDNMPRIPAVNILYFFIITVL